MTGPRMDFRKLGGDPPGNDPPRRIDIEGASGFRVLIVMELQVTRGQIFSPGDREVWTYIARSAATVVEAGATFLSGLGLVTDAAALARHARELGAPWWVA